MSKGNVNGDLKLLRENIANGIQHLTVRNLKMSKHKYRKPNETAPKTLLQAPTRTIHPTLCHESLIMKAEKLIKCSSRHSCLYVDGQRKNLTSRSFGTASSELHKAFPLFVKQLCLEEIRNTEYLDSFAACRLIPPYKRPCRTSAQTKSSNDFAEERCHSSSRFTTALCRANCRN